MPACPFSWAAARSKRRRRSCEADLDTLQSLVDKSLLRFSEDRYWMLETIREYAGERLEADGRAEALRVTTRELASRARRGNRLSRGG